MRSRFSFRHQVYCLGVMGSTHAHSLVSISTDGKMCGWALDMLTQPVEMMELTQINSPHRPLAATCMSFFRNKDDSSNHRYKYPLFMTGSSEFGFISWTILVRQIMQFRLKTFSFFISRSIAPSSSDLKKEAFSPSIDTEVERWEKAGPRRKTSSVITGPSPASPVIQTLSLVVFYSPLPLIGSLKSLNISIGLSDYSQQSSTNRRFMFIQKSSNYNSFLCSCHCLQNGQTLEFRSFLFLFLRRVVLFEFVRGLFRLRSGCCLVARGAFVIRFRRRRRNSCPLGRHFRLTTALRYRAPRSRRRPQSTRLVGNLASRRGSRQRSGAFINDGKDVRNERGNSSSGRIAPQWVE